MKNINMSKLLKILLIFIVFILVGKFFGPKINLKNELVAATSTTNNKETKKEKIIEEAKNSRNNKKIKENKKNSTNGNRKYDIDYDHIIGGDYNRSSGKVTGGHTTLKGDVKVIKKIQKASKNGVYKAYIEIKTPNGKWYPKTSNGGVNTMFPETWNEDRVIEEINSAWENRKDLKGRDNNMWQGISKSGVIIRGYKSPRITAYPVFEGDR